MRLVLIIEDYRKTVASHFHKCAVSCPEHRRDNEDYTIQAKISLEKKEQ